MFVLRRFGAAQEWVGAQRQAALPLPGGRSRRSEPGQGAYSEARKAEILRAYQERTKLRGLTRTFGVSQQTVTAWLKKSPQLAATGPDAAGAPSG